MKQLHWITLLIGYLIGSFFGLTSILALFGGMGKKQTAPVAAQ